MVNPRDYLIILNQLCRQKIVSINTNPRPLSSSEHHQLLTQNRDSVTVQRR